ncbi:MAG: CHAT domain-containing protein, partial [Leptolyngbya sp. SIO4C5]|nr:CHAT domain-containing protein [Leptolyngbya sp. SIO4C5]
ALDYYQRSLAIRQEIGDRGGEAVTFKNIGEALEKQSQSELAIVFYKQSVNVYESIRGGLSTLDTDLQSSYTDSIADTYRSLADLLLQQNRVIEAQRVLDLLKVQELEDYLQDVRGNAETATGTELREPEQAIQAGADAILQRAIALGQELAQLEQIDRQDRTPEQQARVTELRRQLQAITAEYLAFLASDEVENHLAQLRQVAQAPIDLEDFTNLQDNLRNLQQDAVLLYPLVLEERLELVLVTPDAPPVRQPVAVSREDLNRAIVALRQALEDPTSDAITPAQTLYDYLIAPLAPALAAAGAKTLIYAPDGALRYVPLAALHDGDRWLIETYRVNNITATSLTELNTNPTGDLDILAAAFSEGEHFVESVRQTFAGLAFAGVEVSNLAALIPGTTQLFNQDFQPDVALKMNDYNIVHLATHAAFVPGTPADSFILFGNGAAVTLEKVRTWPLTNVDLMVLSACETGLGDQLGNGEEVLGLGYQIQRAGAKAALASLWQVSDGGTQVLMNAFYRALSQGMTKAESLRQAQIALITDDFRAVGGERGTIVPVSAATGEPIGADNKLSHPYFWAPFILIGNGL